MFLKISEEGNSPVTPPVAVLVGLEFDPRPGLTKTL